MASASGKLRDEVVMGAVCMAVFISGMDQSILATVTPIISNDFHTLQDLAWWTNAYLVTISSLQLFYGKLYSLTRIAPVYVVALCLFEAGTLISALARSSTVMIVGRAVTGTGGAGIYAGSVLLASRMSCPSLRLGVLTGVYGLASVVGLFLDAAIVQATSWRWCFGLNLLLLVCVIIVMAVLVRSPRGSDCGLRDTLRQLDLPGTACIVACLVCLLVALQSDHAAYPWNHARTICLLVAAGVLAVVFTAMQTTSLLGSARTIPASLMRSRDTSLAVAYAFLSSGAVYIPNVYLPVWLETARGLTPLAAGTLLTPFTASFSVFGLLAGAMTAATAYFNPPMLLGAAFMTAGAAALATMPSSAGNARIIGSQLLYGSGMGLSFTQPIFVVQTLLPSSDVPVAITVITLAQNLGGCVFVAVAQAAFHAQLRARLAAEMPELDIDRILASGLAGFAEALPPDRLQLGLRVFSRSILSIFYIAVALGGVSLLLALSIRWTSMKPSSLEKPDEEVERQSDQEQLCGQERRTKAALGRREAGLVHASPLTVT